MTMTTVGMNMTVELKYLTATCREGGGWWQELQYSRVLYYLMAEMLIKIAFCYILLVTTMGCIWNADLLDQHKKYKIVEET